MNKRIFIIEKTSRFKIRKTESIELIQVECNICRLAKYNRKKLWLPYYSNTVQIYKCYLAYFSICNLAYFLQPNSMCLVVIILFLLYLAKWQMLHLSAECHNQSLLLFPAPKEIINYYILLGTKFDNIFLLLFICKATSKANL